MEESYSNEKLVSLIQSGADPDGEQLKQLYLQNFGLLRKIARKYSKKAEMDDLLQEGFFALLAAVGAFDAGRGIPFSRYYGMRLEWWYMRYLEEQTGGRDPEVKVLSLDAVDEEGFSLSEIVSDPKDYHEDAVNKAFNEELSGFLWARVDELPGEQSYVLKAFYRDELPLTAICEEIGISYGQGRDSKAKALRALRKGKAAKIFKRFLDEETFSRATRGTGLTRFRETGSSATEAAALWLLNE